MGPPHSIPHVSIRASAGSGKTFVLSHRFIELLARGVPAERITALTFSRKAAREIFESVVGHLCSAALREDGARAVSRRTGLALGRKEYGAILHRLLTSLHRIRVGTIDSFIAGLLRLFPEMYGIPGDFSLFDSAGEEARKIHSSVLVNILTGDRERRDSFAASFSAATAGRHEKRLGRILEEKLTGGQKTFRRAPDCRLWGKGWEGLDAVGDGGNGPVEAAAALLEGGFLDNLPAGAQRRWRDFISGASEWSPGGRWTREMEYLFRKITELRNDLAEGNADIVVERVPHALEGDDAKRVLAIASHVVRSELAVAAERTRGLCSLLDEYEREYCRTVRGEGRFSFDDAVEFAAEGGAYSPSIDDRGEGKLYIEYRLDARLDHWMIDEFQDTSRRQWEVFANLADEVLQSDSGNRSIFVVGDAKQAIYKWRGGDAALLDEVTVRYDERFEKIDLTESYRSCTAVVEAVNMIFGSVEHSALPRGTVDAWRKIWDRHTASEGFVPGSGVAMLVEPSAEPQYKPSPEERYRVTARIAEELLSGRRDLTVGVLLRSNERVRRVGEYIRRHCPSLPVEIDGPAAILDSISVALLLSMVRFAFHPGHSAARDHLLMSPLAASLRKVHSGREGLATHLLAEIRSNGIPEFIVRWGEKIATLLNASEHERSRIDQMHTAALRFVAAGGREGDDFCAYIERYRLREDAGSGQVRVMTVHQSKGLDFDAVILPDLQEWGSMDKARREDLTVSFTTGREVDWVLRTPRRVVSAWDRRLDEADQVRNAEAALQELSLLYVAATRAKSGLYIVTGFPGKSSRALTPAAFVKRALPEENAGGEPNVLEVAGEHFPVLFMRGDQKWHLTAPVAGKTGREDAARQSGRVGTAEGGITFLERVIPSAREESVFDAEWLFDVSSGRSLELGNAVHELFSKVGWINETDIDSIVEEWKEETDRDPGVVSEAVRHFKEAALSKEVARALRRSENCIDLWREKHFDAVSGEIWLSGIFDRVEIFGASRGSSARARVTDFKSDRIASKAEAEKAVRRYRGQMELYAQALTVLLDTDVNSIGMRLIFTGPGMVCDLMPSGSEKKRNAGACDAGKDGI